MEKRRGSAALQDASRYRKHIRVRGSVVECGAAAPLSTLAVL